MAAAIFTPIQPASRPLKQTQEASILERVFLYGAWEELCLMQDFIYFREPMPYAERNDFSPGLENLLRQHVRVFPSYREGDESKGHRDGTDLGNRTSRLYTWHDAESVTQKITKDESDLAISSQIMNFQSLRVLGAGIQNVLPLIGWVKFLKFYCKQHNIKLTTFTFFHKTPSEHCGWFREEMKDVVNKANNKTFTPAGAACDRSGAKMPGKVIYRGVLKNSDQSSEEQNVIDGIRQTTPNVTDGYETTYHFFGASEIFGTHLSDAETISANFATLAAEQSARVLNYGMGGVNFIDVIVRTLSANVASGDTIFLALPFCAAEFSDEKIILDEFDFFDQSHVTPSGALKIASSLYNREAPQDLPLMDQSSYDQAMNLLEIYKNVLLRVEASEYHSQPIQAYCDYLKGWRNTHDFNSHDVIGSVALNCNPITNGHLALIEFARSKVDLLYVIVIEEDKSAVKFKDRFEMVRLACSDFNNVHVIRGGHFVCTEYIAPEYFVKDEPNAMPINFGMESFYFGNFIGPALNIEKIFLGDEPICKVTAAYNKHMQAAMPQYEIDLTIIPRITDEEGNAISASRVRSFIKSENWDKVRQLVPPRAYTYMRENVVL